MKKYILLFAILLSSCETQTEPSGSGYWVVGDVEEKFVNASDDYTDIYTAWLDAHNDKDLEKVLSYETEDVRLELPDGTVIEGKEAHAQALENYFTQDPNLDLYWALPYVGLVNDETWIIAGQVETFTTNEGEQSRLLMIDLKFTEDKISWIIAYEKAIPPQE